MKKLFICSLITSAFFILTNCKTISSVIILGKSDFKEKHFKKEIAFESHSGLIAIKAGLNGSKNNFDFIFDTGAGASVISKKLADSLKLEKKGEITVSDAFGKTSKNAVVTIKELDINGIKFYNWGAVVSDFGKYSPINCVGKDGIIGVNIMADCNWVVNYEKNILTATDSELNFPASASVIPFKGFVPHISMLIGKETIKNVIVDLGSNETITIPNSEMSKNPDLKISNKTYRKVDGGSQGLNGTKLDTVNIYTSDSINIGGKLYTNVNVTSAKSCLLKVGSNFWDKHVFGLDYKKHKIYLSDNTRRSEPVNFTHGFGIRIGIKDGKYVINTVFDNSPAFDAGIKTGEEVTELNGKPITDWFGNYCEGLNWQRYTMEKLEKLSLKITGKNEIINLKNSEYRPVNIP